ncbi:ABC transporter permease [Streptomyces sp. NPDC059506]|uniref:ABC transporter permease n=1 Tax=Streptomyces TaxID=1883 RepID=UPI000CC53076|nr:MULTISPECIES: ABC transporter permease [unclassified Streptomyces]MCZ2524265.1 ABC transporter permease [Streptomyces sp. HB2AG]PLW71672.1 ABC transporter permease [Streptomyces sp. DJ]QMV21715.1 ABC transporter permease subunit [Streptomyces sp. SCUT-3]
MASATAVLQSEWTKVRSVRSTVWTLVTAFAVTVAVGGGISALVTATWGDAPPADRAMFDAAQTSFSGMFLGQLALIVFGVLVIGGEYSTGMIRSSLAAVPQRGVLLAAKVAVATALALVTGMVTSFTAFFVGQAFLGQRATTLAEEGVLRAVFGAGLYMTLITMFAMGVTAMLRSPMLSLGILMPFFFLVSSILAAVPKAKEVAQYFPDQAGARIMQAVPMGDAPYGPWGGLGIMALWVVAALAGGYLVLKKRDA